MPTLKTRLALCVYKKKKKIGQNVGKVQSKVKKKRKIQLDIYNRKIYNSFFLHVKMVSLVDELFSRYCLPYVVRSCSMVWSK